MKFKTILSYLVFILFFSFSVFAQEIIVGTKQEPTSIDPHYHNFTPNDAAALSFFDPLVYLDNQQSLQPSLAESWESVDDLTWMIKLRKGVKFHDGSDFDADDVIYTMMRAPDVPESPSSYAQYIRGRTYEKVDSHTIKVTTEKPNPLFPNLIANVQIISSDLGANVSTNDFHDGKAMIGTGPYKFVSWTPGESLVMEKNQNYWGAKASFDKITLQTIKSAPARSAALLSGEVDMIDSVPLPDLETLGADSAITINEGITARTIYLHFDQFRENSPFVTGVDTNPLMDARVRKAISMAIDRKAIVKSVMQGKAVAAAAILPPNYSGVPQDLKVEKYDPEGAKKLLAEAGFPNGFGLTIHGPNDRYVNDAKIAQAVGQMLTKIGIDMKVETMPKSVFFKSASRGGPDGTPQYSFILVGITSSTGEASGSILPILLCYDKEKGYGSANRGRYCNPKVDDMYTEAMATVDDSKREGLLQDIIRITHREDYGILFLHHQINSWATRGNIGYNARTDERTVVRDIYLK